MTRIGYIERVGNSFNVGARDPITDYNGPCAQITWDETWIEICTDPHEANVSLNIEALPFLIQALSEIYLLRAVSEKSE